MPFGLGGYAANFLQGTQDQAEYMLGQRQAAARAFQEFKAQNPTADYGEFQAFVDNFSGGSNYLRGAMPAREVLQELGKQNEINRRNQVVQQRTQALLGQAQQREAFRFLVNEQRKAGKRDPLALVDLAAEQFGIDKTEDPNAYLELSDWVRSENPEAMMRQLDQDDFYGNLDRIQKGVTAGVYTSEDSIFDDIPDYFKGTPYEQRLKDVGRNAYLGWQGERRAKLTDMSLSMALPLIREGADFGTVMDVVEKNYGSVFPGTDMNWNDIREVARTVWEKAKSEEAAEMGSKFAKANDEIFTFISSGDFLELLSNDEAGATMILEDRIRNAYGPSLDDAAAKLAVEAALRRARTLADSGRKTAFKEQRGKLLGSAPEALDGNRKALEPFFTKDTPANIKGAFATLSGQGLVVDPGAAQAIIDDITGNDDISGQSASQLARWIADNYPGAVNDPEAVIKAQLDHATPETREDRLTNAIQEFDGVFEKTIKNAFHKANTEPDAAKQLDLYVALRAEAVRLMDTAQGMVEDADDPDQFWALSTSEMSSLQYSDKLRKYGAARASQLRQTIATLDNVIATLRRGGRLVPQGSLSKTRSAPPPAPQPAPKPSVPNPPAPRPSTWRPGDSTAKRHSGFSDLNISLPSFPERGFLRGPEPPPPGPPQQYPALRENPAARALRELGK